LHMFPQASTAKIQPSTTMHWVAFLANAAEGFEASWPSPRNLITLQVEYVECALMVEPQTTPLFFLAGCSWWWFGGPLYWKPTDTYRTGWKPWTAQPTEIAHAFILAASYELKRWAELGSLLRLSWTHILHSFGPNGHSMGTMIIW
jgi:hypothetical protein